LTIKPYTINHKRPGGTVESLSLFFTTGILTHLRRSLATITTRSNRPRATLRAPKQSLLTNRPFSFNNNNNNDKNTNNKQKKNKMTSSLPITPNTRSEAEAALTYNSLIQTSAAAEAPSTFSAAPASPPHPSLGSSFDPSLGARPMLQTRSSTNYIAAVASSAQKAASAITSSDNSSDMLKEQILTSRPKAADAGASGGPLVGMAGNVRVGLGRQQSFAKEDLKRLMQERLLAQSEEDKRNVAAEGLQGYSGVGGGAAGY